MGTATAGNTRGVLVPAEPACNRIFEALVGFR